jgi:multidrug efflux pump subunit AcrA (membrane-fusion protein)
MENLGKATADTIYLLASLTKTFNETNLSKVFGLSVFANISKLAELGSQMRGESTGKNAAYSPTSMYFTIETAERAKLIAIIKKGNATEKEKQRLAALDLAAKKKEAELDALKKKFDVDRINLETALANSKDEAEKARIRSLLTIMDEDANSAAKRMAELDTANAAKMKAELTAAESLRYLAEQAARAALGLASIGNPGGNYNYTAAAPSFVYGAGSVPDLPGLSNMPEAGNPQGIYDYSASNPSFTYSPPQVNNITINTPVGTEDYLTEAMQRALQKLNRYGDSTTFAGAL